MTKNDDVDKLSSPLKAGRPQSAAVSASATDQRRPKRSGGRDDRLDEDLDRERLEPGLNADGTGGAGAAKPKDGSSKTF